MALVKSDAEEEWSDFNDASNFEVVKALDWLDTMEGPDGSARPSGSFSASGGGIAARRPNAHGGVLSRSLHPLSNRTQKLASHIRVTPLEV
jgi:RIO kinase 1